MRLTRLFLASTVLISTSLNPAFYSTSAAAQQAPAASSPLPCSGSVNIVRVSEIKTGMMPKFLQAVAAQAAWYKNAGMPDQIGVMRIMAQDATTKKWSLSESQAMTTHIIPSGGKAPVQNAAWDAFVAMFSDSSTIKNSYMACMAQ